MPIARILIAILLSLVLTGKAIAAAAEFRPWTIEQVFENWRRVIPTPLPEAVVRTYPNDRVELTLQATGKVRPLSAKASNFLKDYAASGMVPTSFAALFTHEIEVREGSRVVWAALQQSLVSVFSEELKGGGPVRLSAIVAGLNKGDIVLLTIGFEALPR